MLFRSTFAHRTPERVELRVDVRLTEAAHLPDDFRGQITDGNRLLLQRANERTGKTRA